MLGGVIYDRGFLMKIWRVHSVYLGRRILVPQIRSLPSVGVAR